MSTQGFPLVMILASWVHFSFALGLIENPQEVSRLAVIAGIQSFTDNSRDMQLMGCIIGTFAILSIIGIILETKLGRWWAVTFAFPQYTILIISFFSDFYILITGKYMDREFDFWLLFAVLSIIMGLCVVHTIAIWERYGRRWV